MKKQTKIKRQIFRQLRICEILPLSKKIFFQILALNEIYLFKSTAKILSRVVREAFV